MTASVTGWPKMGLGVLLDRLQHEAGELLGRVGLAGQFDRPVAAHVALEEAGAAVGVHDPQFLGRPAHEQLAVQVDAHDRRREILAQGIGDQPRAVGRHVGRHGVGRSQVDADDRAHRRCRSLECTERSNPPGRRQDSVKGSLADLFSYNTPLRAEYK